jgi:Fe2+ transport system protein B
MVHHARALEQFLSARAAPTALYTALLQVLLCTACHSKAAKFRKELSSKRYDEA